MELSACTDHGLPGNGKGYARVRLSGIQTYLHREVCAESNGLLARDIPPGIVVRHTCDNTRCINKEHLLFGTQSENILEAVTRGRVALGSARPQALLDEAAVKFLRAVYKPRHRQYGTRGLARLFGVSQWTISHAIRGITWRHVDAATNERAKV